MLVRSAQYVPVTELWFTDVWIAPIQYIANASQIHYELTAKFRLSPLVVFIKGMLILIAKANIYSKQEDQKTLKFNANKIPTDIIFLLLQFPGMWPFELSKIPSSLSLSNVIMFFALMRT